MTWSFEQAVADAVRATRQEGLLLACYRDRVYVTEADALASGLADLDAARAGSDEEAEAEALADLRVVAAYGAGATVASLPTGGH